MYGQMWAGPTRGRSNVRRIPAYTHHPADGATDGVGLELTVKAPGHLVHLQEEEQRMGTGNSGRNPAKIK